MGDELPKLTGKQEVFCREYLVDLNGKKAAIRAGYSERSAGMIACENMNKPNIQARVQELMDERNKSVDVDAQFVLRRLMDFVEADIADLYDDNEQLIPISEWPEAFRKGLVGAVDVEELRDGQSVIGNVSKIKLLDRHKSLEMVARHLAFFNDRLDVSTNLTPEEWLERMSDGRKPEGTKPEDAVS